MKPSQAWQDTICLMAGGCVKRPAPPGEYIEILDSRRKGAPVRKTAWMGVIGLLAAVRLFGR